MTTIPRVFFIEGLDRLGKTTLINQIRSACGFYQVVHYQKPELLQYHLNSSDGDKKAALLAYQKRSFETMFEMAVSNGHFIFDRAHLGECVYAPLYRGYDGSYVFDLERRLSDTSVKPSVRLILLTEDFNVSDHFVDDGLSFDVSKRQQEQQLFLDAFNRSNIRDKRTICVTDRNGKFRWAPDILREALQGDTE